jgi:hypothetical protein
MHYHALMSHVVRSLEFPIRPSPETNDHEVRIVIDGKDILDRLDDGMGLDPSEFFEQSALLKGGRVLIGRCSCGTIGCGDFATDVTIGEAFIEWRGDGGIFVFPTSTYSGLIVGAANDHSWEDVNRRTERLVSQALAGVTLEKRESVPMG